MIRSHKENRRENPQACWQKRDSPSLHFTSFPYPWSPRVGRLWRTATPHAAAAPFPITHSSSPPPPEPVAGSLRSRRGWWRWGSTSPSPPLRLAGAAAAGVGGGLRRAGGGGAGGSNEARSEASAARSDVRGAGFDARVAAGCGAAAVALVGQRGQRVHEKIGRV